MNLQRSRKRIISTVVCFLLLSSFAPPNPATARTDHLPVKFSLDCREVDPPKDGTINSPNETNGEIGSDFNISSMGLFQDPDYDALKPAVAYNSTNQQYLVVWSGSEDIVAEYEIWGQRVNAVTGAQYGSDFKISVTGFMDDDDPLFDANEPDIVYNPTANEYLVVWSADHYINGEFEIFGRRIDAATGSLLSSQVRITVMGPTNNVNYDAEEPAVTYNRDDNEYLIVFSADTDAGSLVDGEFEIWAKRLDSSGNWVGTEMRMSDMGGTGDPDYDARTPDVVYDAFIKQYFIVWEGDDPAGALVNDEYEIWGQRVNSNLVGLGNNDFRISNMGTDGIATLDAQDPVIAYNAYNAQYLVVWEADHASDSIFDIYGQRLNYTGLKLGTVGFPISIVNAGPNFQYDAINPAVTWDSANNEYFVVWQDDELGLGEYEIWGQRLTNLGTAIDLNTRLSDMGPDGDATLNAQTPAIIYGDQSTSNQYLIAWSGDNTTNGEFEIWAQHFLGSVSTYIPVVMR